MFEIQIEDGIATLRMAHGKANALDADFLRAFAAELAELERADVDAVVLTGSGAVFSAGADLFRVRDEGAPYVESSLPLLSKAFHALFEFPRPVVAAVNGHAIAGGAVLTCACDYRIMARGAGTIGVGELRVGLPFPAIALEIVRFAAGAGALQEIVYLAEPHAPEAALALRLVDELTEPGDLLPRAREIARRLGAIPRPSFLHTKRALRRNTIASVERYAPDADAEAVAIWSSPALQARIGEFLNEMFGERARRKA